MLHTLCSLVSASPGPASRWADGDQEVPQAQSPQEGAAWNLPDTPAVYQGNRWKQWALCQHCLPPTQRQGAVSILPPSYENLVPEHTWAALFFFPSSPAGNSAEVFGRPLSSHPQHPPRAPPSGCQILLWLPGRAGRQTGHHRPRHVAHLENQQVRRFNLPLQGPQPHHSPSLEPCQRESATPFQLCVSSPSVCLCDSGWTSWRILSSYLTSIRRITWTPACLSLPRRL